MRSIPFSLGSYVRLAVVMDGAVSTQPEFPLSYAGPPPVLIAGDSDAALRRAADTIGAAGLRIADRVGVDAAIARIDRQISASALWIELDGDGGPPMDRLLDRLNGDARAGRYSAVVAGPLALVDVLAARLTDPAIALLIDGDEAERAAALAIAMSGATRAAHVADVASDRGAARLRQLSDEVARIAATLARLSAGPEASAATPPPAAKTGDAPAVPATTALRWIKTMTDSGLFVRRADPHDGRRVFVEMAPDTSLAMRRYFVEIGKPAVV